MSLSDPKDIWGDSDSFRTRYEPLFQVRLTNALPAGSARRIICREHNRLTVCGDGIGLGSCDVQNYQPHALTTRHHVGDSFPIRIFAVLWQPQPFTLCETTVRLLVQVQG